MSKLIIEMEMPRNCDECEVNYDCAFCGITGSAFYGNTQIPNFMPDKQKLPDCPIVGVLPEEHGDLIDRDELKKKKVYSYERHEYVVPVACIDWEQAVIVAERKDDEQIH